MSVSVCVCVDLVYRGVYYAYIQSVRALKIALYPTLMKTYPTLMKT